jgi:hypothetical protein
VDQRDPELPEGLDHLLGLVHPHQPVVDEDAGEALADGAVDEQRGDRGVHPAGEAADDAALADLGADRVDLLRDHRLRRPVVAALGDVAEETGEDVRAVGRVDDLRVELNPVEAAVGRLEGGHGRPGAGGERGEPGGGLEDRVAVAHPAALLLREPAKEAASAVAKGQVGAAELPRLRALDPAAERQHHRLHAVTDAEDRDAQIEQLGREGRRARLVDRGRAAGEDERLRVAAADLLRGGRGGQHLGEDAALADAPSDQLRVLAAEVEDQDLLGRRHLLRTGRPGGGSPLDIDLGRVRPRLADEPARCSFRGAVTAQSSATPTASETAARPFDPIPTDCSVWSFLPSDWSAGATITSARWNERMSS